MKKINQFLIAILCLVLWQTKPIKAQNTVNEAQFSPFPSTSMTLEEEEQVHYLLFSSPSMHLGFAIEVEPSSQCLQVELDGLPIAQRAGDFTSNDLQFQILQGNIPTGFFHINQSSDECYQSEISFNMNNQPFEVEVYNSSINESITLPSSMDFNAQVQTNCNPTQEQTPPVLYFFELVPNTFPSSGLSFNLYFSDNLDFELVNGTTTVGNVLSFSIPEMDINVIEGIILNTNNLTDELAILEVGNQLTNEEEESEDNEEQEEIIVCHNKLTPIIGFPYFEEGQIKGICKWTADESSTSFYEFQHKQESENEWQTSLIDEEQEFIINSLSPNTSYQWRVRTFCIESGLFSEWSSVQTLYTYPKSTLSVSSELEAAISKWIKVSEDSPVAMDVFLENETELDSREVSSFLDFFYEEGVLSELTNDGDNCDEDGSGEDENDEEIDCKCKELEVRMNIAESPTVHQSGPSQQFTAIKTGKKQYTIGEIDKSYEKYGVAHRNELKNYSKYNRHTWPSEKTLVTQGIGINEQYSTTTTLLTLNYVCSDANTKYPEDCACDKEVCYETDISTSFALKGSSSAKRSRSHGITAELLYSSRILTWNSEDHFSSAEELAAIDKVFVAQKNVTPSLNQNFVDAIKSVTGTAIKILLATQMADTGGGTLETILQNLGADTVNDLIDAGFVFATEPLYHLKTQGVNSNFSTDASIGVNKCVMITPNTKRYVLLTSHSKIAIRGIGVYTGEARVSSDYYLVAASERVDNEECCMSPTARFVARKMAHSPNTLMDRREKIEEFLFYHGDLGLFPNKGATWYWGYDHSQSLTNNVIQGKINISWNKVDEEGKGMGLLTGKANCKGQLTGHGGVSGGLIPVVLQWNNNSNYANTYQLERSVDNEVFEVIDENICLDVHEYEDVVDFDENSVYYYRMKVIGDVPYSDSDYSNVVTVSATQEAAKTTLTNHTMKYEVLTAYPTIVKTHTTIEYELAQTSNVQLHIFDLTGRSIAHLLSENNQKAGTYQVHFDAKDLEEGIYLLKMDTGHDVQTLRLVKM